MNSKAILAAIALSLAAGGTALAQDVNPGVEQLAAELNVDAGLFTQEQLIRLKEARENSDSDVEAYIMANPEGPSANAAAWDRADRAQVILRLDAVNPGVAQLAEELNVEPGLYSHTQLIQLKEARAGNNSDVEKQILDNPRGPLAG